MQTQKVSRRLGLEEKNPGIRVRKDLRIEVLQRCEGRKKRGESFTSRGGGPKDETGQKT